MTSFTAINIIPDSDTDSELDNTLELQIEEALKIYQKAIKAHSERNWQEAEKSYEELFNSEIFEQPGDFLDDSTATSPSSSIHSILYLAFKNHAAFLLDRLKAQETVDIDDAETRRSFELGLIWFTEALVRDSGDSSLWRNTAQISKIFNSSRMARFCLESVIQQDRDGDDFNQSWNLSQSGLRPDEFLASLKLRDLLTELQDNATCSTVFFQWLKNKRAKVTFNRHLDPYPWLNVSLPVRPYVEQVQALSYDPLASIDRHILHVPTRTWAAIGKMLLKRRHMVDEKINSHLSNYVRLDVPPSGNDSPSSTPSSVTPQETTPISTGATIAEDGDVQMEEVPQTITELQKDSSNRKRKSTSLGGVDEPGRSRLSKRVRDRENAQAAAAVPPPVPVRQLRSEDDKLFSTAGTCFGPLGISLGKASSLKIRIRGDENDTEPKDLYLRDFKDILRDWDDDKGNVVLYGEGIQDPKEEATPGTALLSLEAAASSNSYHPILSGGEGIRRWLKNVDKECLHVREICLEWLKALLMRDHSDSSWGPGRRKNDMLGSDGKSSWLRHSWPEPLRDVVVAMVNDCEELLWSYFKEWEIDFKKRLHTIGIETFSERDFATIEWAQTVFEIYLGDLAASDKERSSVDTEEVQEKWELLKDTCRRWSYLVGDLIHCRPRDEAGELPEDQLTFRYLWANAVFTGFTHASREFVLDCFEDLKTSLLSAAQPIIELPNSIVMPEISAARAEREISKLKTMDFFTSIFRATTHMSDPMEVIANLEAVLYPQNMANLNVEEGEEQHIEEMARFLEGSSPQFKLYLWDRLREAYQHEDVNLPPKVLACHLKCIDLIVSEFSEPGYAEHSEDHRQFILLRAIRLLESTIPEALKLALADRQNLSQDSDDILLNSLRSLFALLRLLHTYSFFEDGVLNSEYTSSDLHSYRLVVAKLRELLVKTWCLTYLIYREIIEGEKGRYDLPDEPAVLLGNLLRDIHDELGVRHYCKLSNRSFLKLLQSEYLRFNLRIFDEELAQCLHCRYHLNVGPDQWELYEHKTEAEALDKKSALQILDFVLLMASKKKVHQLPKADIKSALDKMVETIGLPKKDAKLRFNEEVIDQYLASSIHPSKLRDCLKGQGAITTAPITGDHATAALKGLYFLMGHIHLSLIRDRSVKGRVQVKGDDLDMSLRYFKYTLMVDPENWESWYRLAQTYGQQVDEDMTWTADAMTNHRSDLVKKERWCILCFIMAVSTSVRNADDSEETGEKLAKMYFEFGSRIYASLTPPMSGETWEMNDFVRHYSGSRGEGMYKKEAHTGVSRKMALQFVVALIEKALIEEPGNWKFHYVLGKCMGKLQREIHKNEENKNIYEPEHVLERFSLAVKYAPEKAGSELLLEPHHKLVSCACKYVMDDLISPSRAYEYVSNSAYCKGVTPPIDKASYVTISLAALAKMRSADKQKWHHRMTHRITQLTLKCPAAPSPQSTNADPSITAATKEFSSLFTNKASTLSIWRPENERPGRHFVFASNYTILYVSLLEKLQDRATLEAVAKRVRKNASGLWNHPRVWETTYRAYVSVLRSTGNIEPKLAEQVFTNSSMGWGDFQTCSAKLETYCNSPSVTQQGEKGQQLSPLLETFKEIVELRRLNMGFGNSTEIDELLADAYAKLYKDLLPELIKAETAESSTTASPTATEPATTVTNINATANTTTSTSFTNANNNPMSLRNLMVDDSGPSTAPASPAPLPNVANSTPTPTSVANTSNAKADADLPMRQKLTKVTLKDVTSKAYQLFKPAPSASGKGAAAKDTTITTAAGSSFSSSGALSQKDLQAQQQLRSAAASMEGTNAGGSNLSGTSRKTTPPASGGRSRRSSDINGNTIVVAGHMPAAEAEDEVMGSPYGSGGDEGDEGDGDDEAGDDGDDDGDGMDVEGY